MKEIKFASSKEAMQYLANFTGRNIRIAVSQSLKRVYDTSTSKSGIVSFYIEKEFDNSWTWSEHIETALQNIRNELAKVKSALSGFDVLDPKKEFASVGVGNKSNKLSVTMDSEIKFNTEEEMEKIISVLESLEYDPYKR